MSYFSSGRSRSLQRSSYSSPSSRSQTPIRSRSSSIEPSSYGFGSGFGGSRPISRASSLQTLQSTGIGASSYYSSSYAARGAASSALNRYKSASVTGLSTPSSYSPYSSSSYQPASLNRYSSTSTTIRTSLVDIRRPPTIDRYQSTAAAPSVDRFQLYRSKYSGASPVIPPSAKYIREQITTTPKYYAGSAPFLTIAKQQGIGAYTKLLQYSFTGNRSSDRSSSAGYGSYGSSSGVGGYSSSYSGRYATYDRFSGGTATSGVADRYGSRASDRYTSGTADRYAGRSGGLMFDRSSYRSSGISKVGGDDASDLYKTRFRPSGAMSKYWTQPRRLFTG